MPEATNRIVKQHMKPNAILRGVRIGLVAFSALSLPACEKYALDHRMDDLCKKDGGLIVYERITLPASRFDENGEIILRRPIGLDHQGVYGPEYRLITDQTSIKEGDPVRGEGRLVRTERRLVRVSDDKLLGLAIRYGRSGGDLIAFPHFSSKSCPPPGAGNSIESVFLKGE
jgi:hypothetical protein